MAANAEDLKQQVLALPEGDRAGLAADLVASLDMPSEHDQGIVDSLWNDEITRRARAVAAGEAELVEWPEARDGLIDRLSK